MKRKLFSAILFGALLTASTSGLTSCKDYDDDISNLQSQIDKLATADQLSAKVAEMQAAISAAQSAAEAKAAAAQTVADAAKSAAADAAAAASKAQSTADAASKDAAAAAAAAAEVQKAADKAIADLEAKAATKEELKAAADAAEAAVKAIQDAHAADKAAIEKAIADGLAEVKAEIAKTNEELGKLAARLDAVETKLAAIEAGEGQEEALKEIQEEVEAIAEVLEDIIGEYTSMVTEVSLYAAGKTNNISKYFDNDLKFIYVDQEKTTTFPAEEGVADRQFEFSDKNKNVTTTDSLLIRVSPTNAVLNAANISLINSQGKDLSEFVEVKSVKPYAELITRSAEGNGLWNVEFKIKEGIDRAKFVEAVTSNNKSVLFAVAVKNTESEETRRVISAYDVTATPYTFEPARSAFQVTNRDGKWFDVSILHNRYDYDNNKGYAVANESGSTKTEDDVYDYSWSNEPYIAGTTSGRTWKADKRSNKACNVEVAIGQPIELSVATYMDPAEGGTPEYIDNSGSLGSTKKYNTNFAIKGFYVTLDKDFAIESNPSEWKAWKSYTYENVGIPGTDVVAKLFDGNTGSITITDEDALGDYIGFRVYAVNLDGTLVDPDGRAFYVHVASEKQTAKLTVDDLEAVLNYDAQKNTYHWTGAANSNYYSASVDLDETVAEILNNNTLAGSIKWEIVSNASAYGNNVTPVEDGDYQIVLNKNNNGKYVSAKVIINNPLHFLDGGTYTAAATIKNDKGTELCDVTVNFKKTIPTEAPAIAWTEGYDPAKQVFANTPETAAYKDKIYKITAGGDKPQAVELNYLMNSLTLGSATMNTSYYTLNFKDVILELNSDGTPKKIDKVQVPKTAPTATNARALADYQLTPEYFAIDGKDHAISYNYNYGQISLTKDYQTGNYKEDKCNPAGKASLSMKFATWSMYENYALKNALTLTYAAAQAGAAAGTLNLGYSKGSDGTTTYTQALKVSSNIVAVSATAANAYSEYYSEVDGKFYKFNITTWKYKTMEGGPERDFVNADPSNDDIKTYGIEMTIDTSKKYVKVTCEFGAGANKKTKNLLVEAAGNATGTSASTQPTAGTLYKKVGNTYYKVVRLTDNGVDEFKFADASDRVLTNQSESSLADNNDAVEMPNGTLAQTKPLYENYKKPNTTGAVQAYESDIEAWNTVVFNYDGTGAKATPRFGTAAVKADFGKLVSDDYLKIIKVWMDEKDPFEITYTTMPADHKFTIKQKVGQLTPAPTGTIYIKVEDCFHYVKTIVLTYNIR